MSETNIPANVSIPKIAKDALSSIILGLKKWILLNQSID
jgi:hypothetical protein